MLVAKKCFNVINNASFLYEHCGMNATIEVQLRLSV